VGAAGQTTASRPCEVWAGHRTLRASDPWPGPPSPLPRDAAGERSPRPPVLPAAAPRAGDRPPHPPGARCRRDNPAGGPALSRHLPRPRRRLLPVVPGPGCWRRGEVLPRWNSEGHPETESWPLPLDPGPTRGGKTRLPHVTRKPSAAAASEGGGKCLNTPGYAEPVLSAVCLGDCFLYEKFIFRSRNADTAPVFLSFLLITARFIRP